MRYLTILLSLLFILPAWSQSVTPPDRSSTTSTRPNISANLPGGVSGARMWVDGKEFTNQLNRRGDTVSLVPPYNLDYGVHQVRLVTNDGRQTNWSFAIVSSNQQGYDFPNNAPNNAPNSRTNNPNTAPATRYPSTRPYIYRNPNANTGYNNNPNTGYNNNPNTGYNAPNTGYNNGVVVARAYGPSPGSVVTVSNPPISASFNGTVRNLRLVVDGRDVTSEATIGNEGVSWTPTRRLDQGQHSVSVTGTAANGQPVRGDWSFLVRYE